MTDLAVQPGQSGMAARGERPSEGQLEQYRGELTGFCYRMLGSPFEAEDAVQDTMVRAWRALERFDGRSSLRSWLYRIATNVCLDMLNGRKRRALPMDMSPSAPPVMESLGVALPESAWIEPMPDGRVSPQDPADVAVSRESIRLAFVAALQQLPPRQRAVLILREVLRWKAEEVAELLEATVASVNSALQRARATMAARDGASDVEPMDEAQQELLTRYVDAFQRYDIDGLVALLHEDATLSMPPYPLWLQGPADIAAWLVGPGLKCRGSHWIQVMANGSAAFAQYRPSGPGGAHEPWALHVVQISGDRISGMITFLDTDRLFPLFGLPQHPAG